MFRRMLAQTLYLVIAVLMLTAGCLSQWQIIGK